MPIADIAAATIPITTLGIQTVTPAKAIDRPTASASMLVATESRISVGPRVGSWLGLVCFSCPASQSILPPTYPNSANAAQWSYSPM